MLNARQYDFDEDSLHIPAGETATKAADKLLTVAQAPLPTVGLGVLQGCEVAMQLPAKRRLAKA